MQSLIDPHLKEITSSKTGPRPRVDRGIYVQRQEDWTQVWYDAVESECSGLLRVCESYEAATGQ